MRVVVRCSEELQAEDTVGLMVGPDVCLYIQT